jgi:hypothetical protein
MDIQTAIEILEHHQEWRLGKREDMIHDPKKLTEAMEIVIGVLKKNYIDAYYRSIAQNYGVMTTQPDEISR